MAVKSTTQIISRARLQAALDAASRDHEQVWIRPLVDRWSNVGGAFRVMLTGSLSGTLSSILTPDVILTSDFTGSLTLAPSGSASPPPTPVDCV